MPNRFASGKNAIAECDRCGFQFKLQRLRKLTVKTKRINLLVCPSCWEADQPQLQLGMYPVDDPQAIQNPRPDTTYDESGLSGLQVDTVNPPDPQSPDAFGVPSGGSRAIQWGWSPVGMHNPLAIPGIPDSLVGQGAVGDVVVEIS